MIFPYSTYEGQQDTIIFINFLFFSLPMAHTVKVVAVESLAPTLYRILLEKPAGFRFIPGHSAMVAINKPQLIAQKNPLTFTATNDEPFLEFHIKTYPERQSFNNLLAALRPGDSLILGEMFGSVRYAGPGLFLAGGIGIAPILAMLRQLKKENSLTGNTLVYSAKYKTDILAERELRHLLGNNFHITLTKEKRPGYHYGRISSSLLQNIIPKFPEHHYVVGSESFVADMRAIVNSR